MAICCIHIDVLYSQAYGEIRTMYTACKGRGLVTVSYHDLRAACLAMHSLAGVSIAGTNLDVHFPPPSEEASPDREEVCSRTLCCTCAATL